MEPKKTKEGEVIQDGIRAEFHDFYFDTDDPKIIEIIKKSSSFGVDYWIYGEPVPVMVKAPPMPHGGAVEKMPSEKAAGLDPISERFKTTETMIMELAKAVDVMSKSMAKPEKKEKGKSGRPGSGRPGKEAAPETFEE